MNFEGVGGPHDFVVSPDGKWLLFGDSIECACARANISSVHAYTSTKDAATGRPSSGLYHIVIVMNGGEKVYCKQSTWDAVQQQYWTILGTTPTAPVSTAAAPGSTTLAAAGS